jgi:hypothetical protein
MFVINISEPITLLLLTLATVLLIFLGKEVKKSYVPAFALFAYLILVVVHSVQLGTLTEEFYETYHILLINCVAIDCVMIFISFFAYLWIDDISSKFYKKKSIDNSLDWFWNKI